MNTWQFLYVVHYPHVAHSTSMAALWPPTTRFSPRIRQLSVKWSSKAVDVVCSHSPSAVSRLCHGADADGGRGRRLGHVRQHHQTLATHKYQRIGLEFLWIALVLGVSRTVLLAFLWRKSDRDRPCLSPRSSGREGRLYFSHVDGCTAAISQPCLTRNGKITKPLKRRM